MAGWALDIGTTNSGIARCDETAQPQLVELPAVCRDPARDDPLQAPRMVPSAVHVLEKPGLLDRLGSRPSVARRAFVGQRALIGQRALERNRDAVHPAFVPTFKAALAAEATRPLARLGRRALSAREVAGLFLREMLAETKRATGVRVRDLVVTSPVSAFETYRAEVQRLLGDLGVRRVRFVDEPVAAALGYGLSLSNQRVVLVVDIGGGTMHVVLVELSPRGSLSGEARVLAKQGRPLGGNAVDGWMLEAACAKAGLPALDVLGDEAARFWRRLMLAEACRVKEALHFEDTAVFRVTPPGAARRSHDDSPGAALPTFTRAELQELLEANGFYRGLDSCLASMFEDGQARLEDVDDVLLVGGSTLLPGVFTRMEQRFERRRLRAWQPFEAVACGGASFAAGRIGALDFIVHDYAFVTHDPRTGQPQYTVVVPRGTRFPTPPDLWKRQLVPTCSLGEPEEVFRLVICEMERGDGSERRFVWDAAGDLHKVGGASGTAEVIVPLNAGSPTLGYLDPPHEPHDRRPRLEIAFAVNAERWLVATVHDLLTRRELMREEPVVRLI
jgi:molecular chaperone DnaK (HSP70)